MAALVVAQLALAPTFSAFDQSSFTHLGFLIDARLAELSRIRLRINFEPGLRLKNYRPLGRTRLACEQLRGFAAMPVTPSVSPHASRVRPKDLCASFRQLRK